MQNSIELMDQFKDLPEDVQNVIRQFKYDDALRALHNKFKLHIDQAATLEKEVSKVLFGEAKSQALIPNLERELRIKAEAAKEIAFDVNTTILIPLQEAMKKIHMSDFDAKMS